MVLDIVIALLAAAGLIGLGWLLLGRILAPVGGRDGGAVYAVVPAEGDGETLEHDVTGLLWLRGGGLARFTVVIADMGLNDRGRSVADILSRRDPGVCYCTAEALAAYIKEK